MRLSRLCVDKPHRCPGWAGGGWHYPRGESRCDNGRIELYEVKAWKWRFAHCNRCDVVTLPYYSRLLDPHHLWHTAKHLISTGPGELRYWWTHR